MTFDVAETTTGHDRAALIDKFGGRHGWIRRERACEGLTSAPSRRTRTCASDPNTTTRCSSTTAAPRSSRFSSAPGVRAARPGARRRLRRRRHAAVARRGSAPRSSASIPSIASSDAGRAARPRARAAQPALRARRRHGAAVRGRRFDLVLSHAVIEHVADAPLYLRECARVLTPDGRVLSVDGAVPVVCRRASAAIARCRCRCT